MSGTPKPEQSSAAIAGEEELDRLQREFDAIRKERLQERFLWLFAVIIIIDFYVFPQLTSWSAPLAIGLLEFVFITVCGTALGVDHIYTIVMRLIDKWKGGSVK